MKGCSPSPVIGMRKILAKRFRVKEVDEFKTSKICNACSGELSSYRKKDGKLYTVCACAPIGNLDISTLPLERG